MSTNHIDHEYELYEAGNWYDVIVTKLITHALAVARKNVDVSRYRQPTIGCTVYVDIAARRKGTHADNSSHELWDTITVYPAEPPCAPNVPHIWRAPETVVGRGEFIPGMVCRGRGLIISEICALCGWYKIEDTYAMRPDTGEIGYSSVRFKPPDDKSKSYVSECAALLPDGSLEK